MVCEMYQLIAFDHMSFHAIMRRNVDFCDRGEVDALTYVLRPCDPSGKVLRRHQGPLKGMLVVDVLPKQDRVNIRTAFHPWI